MYFFVQIERALLREGLEADGALERPLPCAANARTRGDRETKQNHDGQIILLSSVTDCRSFPTDYHEGILPRYLSIRHSLSYNLTEIITTYTCFTCL